MPARRTGGPAPPPASCVVTAPGPAEVVLDAVGLRKQFEDYKLPSA